MSLLVTYIGAGFEDINKRKDKCKLPVWGSIVGKVHDMHGYINE